MELLGQRLIPASRERTWAALNDPGFLRSCIAGCESLQHADDGSLQALMAVRVGPVSARFKGRLVLADVRPPESYTLHFDGQGGVAGFGKGSAEVRLEPESPTGTRLHYAARAQVGGKLAQVGSRLVDAAAAKIADDFFQAFEDRLRIESGALEVAEQHRLLMQRRVEQAARGTRRLLWALAWCVAVVVIVFSTR